MADVPSAFPLSDFLEQPWTDRLEALRAQSFAPGVLGPYRILRLLGRGGMGSVYLAERADGRFERQVAIKLLDPGFTLSREAAALAKLDHPHIASILDAGSAPDGRHFLVLQYVDGTALSATTLASPEAIARCFLALTSALAHAHERGILHRDIKPSNVLIDVQGFPILIDFSAATDAKPEAPDSTKTMYRAWTPSFASPEQLAGEAGTVQSDVYSLGLLLRTVLNGKDPSPLELDLRRIANKAAEELPSLRYSNAAEMARDIQAAIDRKPILAQRPRRHRAWALSVRRRPYLLTTAVLFMGLSVGLALAWMQQREREIERRIRALDSISSPSLADASSDDPRGTKSRALLGSIEEWSGLREEYGPRPPIIEGLYMATQGYAHLLLGPAASRVENFEKAFPYLQNAIRLSDSMTSTHGRPCQVTGRRFDSRIALANAYLSRGELLLSGQLIDGARKVVNNASDSNNCRIATSIQLMELDAVGSRILFAQKRWQELIPIRRSLLARREAFARLAREESWSDSLNLQVAAEHARTSLGWALHHGGNSREGFKEYNQALANLEILHRRAPSMTGITFRLAKFHREAAEIAVSLQNANAEALHKAKAKEFQDALEAH